MTPSLNALFQSTGREGHGGAGVASLVGGGGLRACRRKDKGHRGGGDEVDVESFYGY